MPHSMHEQNNNTIFHEMMSHPVLFTHPHPKKVAVIGDETSDILHEVLKHPHLAEIIFVTPEKIPASQTDPKIKFYSNDPWKKLWHSKFDRRDLPPGPTE